MKSEIIAHAAGPEQETREANAPHSDSRRGAPFGCSNGVRFKSLFVWQSL